MADAASFAIPSCVENMEMAITITRQAHLQDLVSEPWKLPVTLNDQKSICPRYQCFAP